MNWSQIETPISGSHFLRFGYQAKPKYAITTIVHYVSSVWYTNLFAILLLLLFAHIRQRRSIAMEKLFHGLIHTSLGKRHACCMHARWESQGAKQRQHSPQHWQQMRTNSASASKHAAKHNLTTCGLFFVMYVWEGLFGSNTHDFTSKQSRCSTWA